jgi:hypothetical protein
MSDTTNFPKDLMTEFIEVYHQHPALWKVKSKEYVNENLQNQGYVTLLEICKKFDPSANKDYLCKKIPSLRGSFRKELKKVEESRAVHPQTTYTHTHTSTFRYYDLLRVTIDRVTNAKHVKFGRPI